MNIFNRAILGVLLIHLVQGQLCVNTTCPVEQNVFTVPIFGGLTFPYIIAPSQPEIMSYQPNITIAIIVIHGTDRDADDYYCYMKLSVDSYFTSSEQFGVYIAAPHFRTDADPEIPGAFFWDGNEGWKDGGLSSKSQRPRMSSFDILDAMVLLFANRTYYPNLEHIIVAGHSAGGQVTHRYALGNGVDDDVQAAGISLKYVPANPSSYAYLDGTRPSSLPPPICGEYCNASLIPTANYTFATPSSSQIANCTTYNEWRYGLDKLNTYMSRRPVSDIVKEYATRDVTYLLGANDTCNNLFNCSCDDTDMDTECEAELEGYCRFQRGWAYYHYVMAFYNNKTAHSIYSVPGVGHDGCLMFNSEMGQYALFNDLVLRAQFFKF